MGSDEKKYVVGFDLGATKMLAVVFDSSWKTLGRSKARTNGFCDATGGLDRMKETVVDALKAAGVPAGQVTGIGVGSPGPVDPSEGVLLDPPNLGCRNVPIRKTLEKTFACSVSVLNDVDAGTYAEYLFGAGRKKRCVLGVFPGTGIGGGCVYDGAIVQGRRISCMEIGHVCVQPDGPLCGCGRRGCLEAVASRLAIAQAAAAAAYRGQAPYLRKEAGSDLKRIRSSMLAAAIKNGDRVIEDIVRRAAGRLGMGVAMAVNLLAPDVVVLGGGLVEAMPDIYLKETLDSARQYAMPTFAGTFDLAVAELGDDAVVRGAAAWAAREAGVKT